MQLTAGPFERYAICLNPQDNVAVAKEDIPAGWTLARAGGEPLVCAQAVPAGHKLALRDLAVGQTVLRYGQRIGQASAPIRAGDWVHSHNLAVGPIVRDFQSRAVPAQPARPSGRTFQGYRRADGQAGTRNYVAVIATVNCATAAASRIAAHFDAAHMAAYPNVDGVVAITHAAGCSVAPDSHSLAYLRRALANLAHNPNLAAVIYVGLGCEVNQLEGCTPAFAPEELQRWVGPGLLIQEQGGLRKTVEAGILAVEQALAQADRCRREALPLGQLCVALQCGGSDGWSGVTANPLVGRVADRLVEEGGAVMLAETPEIFGAEHLLLERVADPAVGERLAQRLSWWVEHSRRHGFSVDNNPTPGNKAGGLTTIFEKSLGALAKGGSTPLVEVLEYAERVTRRGLIFMDTPGNDPVSVSGELAGGCSLILFTTGRGTIYGSSLAPCLKIASNSRLFQRMPEDMDFDAGQLLGRMSWAEAEERLLVQVITVASGQRTASETYLPREGEFAPWQPDPLL